MKEIREQINTIDEQLLKLLSERRELSLEIIKLKNVDNSSIRDKERVTFEVVQGPKGKQASNIQAP